MFYKNPFYINILLSLLTILLLSFSFPSPCISFLAWFALVPWCIIISSGHKIGLFSYLIGVIFFVSNLSWLRFVTYPGWFLLCFYLALYFYAFGIISHYIRRKLKLPNVLVFPFVWSAFEFIRSFPFTGFPWFFLGHSQYLDLPLIQISDITGVYGVSFLIIAVNAAISDLIGFFLANKNFKFIKDLEIPDCRKKWFKYIAIFVPISLLALVLCYGYSGLKDHKIVLNGPNVCAVQGNVPQSVKIRADEMQREEILSKYVDLSLEAIDKEVDLIVWPETMVPGILNIDPQVLDRRIDSMSKELVRDLAIVNNANLLVGGTAIDINRKTPLYFNTAFYYNKKGELEDRYDKIYLVPFGEFIPFERYLSFLSGLVPYEISLSRGDRKTIFELKTKKDNKTFKFGTIICYEDTVPSLIRSFRKQGVDFMVNITNDAWFRDSPELDQHLSIMVFRAVENRVGIVRAGNTGISSFVAPNGEIYDYLARDGKYREIDGILCNRIAVSNTTSTWYTNHGDVFAISCLIISLIGFVYALVRK